METLLHYVWKHRLYEYDPLETIDGLKIEVIDPGLHNTHAGPDFFNAKVKIDGRLWAGNIEIHTRSSDWFLHGHEKNPVYNSVILHVVEWVDVQEIPDENGRNIPQLVLKIPEQIKQNYAYLLSREKSIPCKDQIHRIPDIYFSDWKNALLLERLERKTNGILKLLKDSSGSWNDVFYMTMARNFGFGINNDVFERLAKSLPLQYVLKHKNSDFQVEALFFGQAGLLKEDIHEDSYFSFLQKEYDFLQRKYNLQPIEGHLFKSLRIRPNNFPHVKIAQLAAFTRSIETLFSKMLEAQTIPDVQKLFVSDLPVYWRTHYQFGKQSVNRRKTLGLSAVHILIINTVVPMLVAYGKQKDQQFFVERAIQWLESIPPENNYITNLFKNTGIKLQDAGDSQAIIQLKNEYCDQKKCIFCRIGHKLLSKEQIIYD